MTVSVRGRGAPIADMCTTLCIKGPVATMWLDEVEVVACVSADTYQDMLTTADARAVWVWLRSGVGFYWVPDRAEVPA